MLIKRILFPVLQFFAFFGLLYVGGYWDIFSLGYAVKAMQGHPVPILGSIPLIQRPMGAHILVADGIIFAGILYILILIIQAARRKFLPAALFTTLAFILAAVIAFAMKIGLPPSS